MARPLARPAAGARRSRWGPWVANTGYTYDLADQLTAIDYPDVLTPFDSATGTPQSPVSTGTVQCDYDDDGNLISVTDWLTNETAFGYDADSQLTGITARAAPQLTGITARAAPAPTSNATRTSR